MSVFLLALLFCGCSTARRCCVVLPFTCIGVWDSLLDHTNFQIFEIGARFTESTEKTQSYTEEMQRTCLYSYLECLNRDSWGEYEWKRPADGQKRAFCSSAGLEEDCPCGLSKTDGAYVGNAKKLAQPDLLWS